MVRNLLNPSPRWMLAALVSLAALVAVGTTKASSVGSAPRSVDVAPADLFVAPDGSDRGTCRRRLPCATFGRAYQVAKPGDVVEVAGGRYGVQTLQRDAAKGSGSDVVFRPARGAKVTLAEFVSGSTSAPTGAVRFELRDMRILSYVRVRWGSEDVTLRNLDAAGINLTSARRVRVLGGDFGPMVDGVSHINACGVEGCFPATDVLIDGAVFHDYTVTDPKKHSECLMIWPGRNVTIRNSTFRNCTDFDVLVKPYKTELVGAPGGITFENNVFDEPVVGSGCLCKRGGNAIAITQGAGESWKDVRIRHNSSLGGFRIDPAIRGVVVRGNVGRKDQRSSCQSNVSFSHNVWTGARCSSSDRIAALGSVFVDASSRGFDLELRRGSAAIGAGDPAAAPRLDRKGRLRPRAAAPDAGAFQREQALVLPGRGVGSAALGMSRARVHAWYGTPTERRARAATPGGANAMDAYAVAQGRLRVYYRASRVVAVATTSRFYSTSDGLGPGAKTGARTSGRGTCVAVGRGLFLTLRGRSVREVTVAAPGFTPACASGSTSKPKR